ncbi:hypothetical protein HPULCUR_006941 [Helicostylum pulchrum]|uniref:Uncharacterized protein n=1 Tax=Helicostylum pulchrum TaxID=562976 RepID=A0ABP9Y3B7_9FUNG
MSNRHEVTVSYTTFDETSSPVELIEEVESLLTNLRIGSDILRFFDTVESTGATYQGHFLDHVFKHCSLLKKIECFFFALESCNPKLSINTSIEELVFGSNIIYPIVLEQLSIRLPNLRTMSFFESSFMRYNGRCTYEKKLDINMQHNKFDKLHITRKPTQEYSDFFLKYSRENEDTYFYNDLKPNFTWLSKCSYMDYYVRLSSKTTYFLNLRCKAVRELTIQFGSISINYLA